MSDDPQHTSTMSSGILKGHPSDVVPEEMSGVQNGEDGWLEALEFEDGSVREYKGGFAMYGAEYERPRSRARL